MAWAPRPKTLIEVLEIILRLEKEKKTSRIQRNRVVDENYGALKRLIYVCFLWCIRTALYNSNLHKKF